MVNGTQEKLIKSAKTRLTKYEKLLLSNQLSESAALYSPFGLEELVRMASREEERFVLDEKVIIDTNIWASHALNYPEVVEYINELISNNAEFLMPTVVEMELLSHWEVETNPQVKAVKNHYIYDMTDKIVDVTSEIAQLAAQIRRKAKIESNKKLKAQMR